MASVSLNAVGAQLGRTTGQSVILRLLGLNGYTRVFSSGGYLRVNPFQVQNNNADDPATHSAPHPLNLWEGYVQTQLNSGNDLEITAEGYGEIELLWSLPSGYPRDTANLTQEVYWKDMGTSLDLSVNPFDSPTGSSTAGDGTTHTITGLTEGRFYAIGVKVEWDDSVTTHENADSDAYDPDSGATPLTGAGEGIASDEVFGDTPSIDNIEQDPLPEDCFIGCSGGACPDFDLSVTMEGPSSGRFEVSTTGPSSGFSALDTNVTPGSTSLSHDDLSPDTTYWYRLRYNDVGSGSPGPWSTVVSQQAQCDLV